MIDENKTPGQIKLNDDQSFFIGLIKLSVSETKKMFNSNVKPSRESSLAITKLEEFEMWAVRSVSINGTCSKKIK